MFEQRTAFRVAIKSLGEELLKIENITAFEWRGAFDICPAAYCYGIICEYMRATTATSNNKKESDSCM